MRRSQQIVTGENMQVIRRVTDEGDVLVLDLEGTDEVELTKEQIKELLEFEDVLEIQQEYKTVIFEKDGDKVNFEVQSRDRFARGKFIFCADHWDTLMFISKAFV